MSIPTTPTLNRQRSTMPGSQNKYPDIFQQIQQRVKEGRWEVVGGMWVEPDLNLPDGESTVRQILVAKRYSRKNLGVDVKVGWNPDSFGYTWQLPQIYKKSGIDYFVTQKMAWNDTNQLPLKLFWWQSPDGSRVLTYFPHDYVNQDFEPVRMATDLDVIVDLNPGQKEMMRPVRHRRPRWWPDPRHARQRHALDGAE